MKTFREYLEEKIDPSLKKEFQRWAEEIIINYKKDYEDISEISLNNLLYIISTIILAMSPTNVKHNKLKKYFPKNYDVNLISGSGNLNEIPWFSMTDNEQETIIKKALKTKKIIS